MSEKIYDYNNICESIKNLDSTIRFVGIINERGRLTAGGMKKGVEPLESERDDEMLYMELALRVRMRKEFDAQLGKVKFAMAIREKANAFSFTIRGDILYVVTEPNADYKTLPKKILEIIEK